MMRVMNVHYVILLSHQTFFFFQELKTIFSSGNEQVKVNQKGARLRCSSSFLGEVWS